MSRFMSRREGLFWLTLTAAFFAAMVWSASASGQGIIGPDKSLAGDLVVLDASSYDAEAYEWVLTNSEKAFLPVDGGSKVVFSTGRSGRYTFVCVMGVTRDGELKVATAKHEVTIGSGPIPPGPTPPGPKPVPDGYLGLTRYIKECVLKSVPERSRNHATALSGNYRSVAAQIAAGTINGPAAALSSVTKLNRETVGGDRGDWLSCFNGIQKIMDDNKDKLSRNKENYRLAFVAISDGLAAVPRVMKSRVIRSVPVIRRYYQPVFGCYRDIFGNLICR